MNIQVEITNENHLSGLVRWLAVNLLLALPANTEKAGWVISRRNGCRHLLAGVALFRDSQLISRNSIGISH